MNPRHRRRPRLEFLEGRDAPATLTATFSPVSHTLTVVGNDGANDLTVTGDPADPTHFFLPSATDTFPGGGSTFASPSGVQSISIRMLAGNDSVTLASVPPIHLAGGLMIDGGDGANAVTATDLTVDKGITIRNGKNTSGMDTTTLANPNVGGAVTIANGDGDTWTVIQRSVAGVSTIRGPVSITNGAGADSNYLANVNIGGNVTVRNGRADALGAAGATNFYGGLYGTSRVQVRGSVAVSYLEGTVTSEGMFDTEVGGNVSYAYGAGRGRVYFDGLFVFTPAVIHGNLSVKGTGATTLKVGANFGTGLVLGKNITFAGGAEADEVDLNNLIVGGTTTLKLGDGPNTVTIDDSLLVGAFTMMAGTGADVVNLDTLAGSDRTTTFDGTVRLNLGAGVDSLILGGAADGLQGLVFVSTFIVHHGAEGESATTFGKDVYPFADGLQWLN